MEEESEVIVIDLDNNKTSDDFSSWWKMCIFIESHLRKSKWEADVEVEETRRVESLRARGIHDKSK